MDVVKIERKVCDAAILHVSVAVRYEDEDIPFDAPMREGNLWQAEIDLDNQKIINWPIGKTLDLHMKVCDEGVYTLYDRGGFVIAKLENEYVPNRILPGEYGDYLELKIAGDGKITNWINGADLKDFEEREDVE